MGGIRVQGEAGLVWNMEGRPRGGGGQGSGISVARWEGDRGLEHCIAPPQ